MTTPPPQSPKVVTHGVLLYGSCFLFFFASHYTHPHPFPRHRNPWSPGGATNPSDANGDERCTDSRGLSRARCSHQAEDTRLPSTAPPRMPPGCLRLSVPSWGLAVGVWGWVTTNPRPRTLCCPSVSLPMGTGPEGGGNIKVCVIDEAASGPQPGVAGNRARGPQPGVARTAHHHRQRNPTRSGGE